MLDDFCNAANFTKSNNMSVLCVHSCCRYAVSKQPVINVLRSGCPLLMNYKEGVLTHDIGCECSETSCIDHATVVTGYNTTHSPPYWKVSGDRCYINSVFFIHFSAADANNLFTILV